MNRNRSIRTHILPIHIHHSRPTRHLLLQAIHPRSKNDMIRHCKLVRHGTFQRRAYRTILYLRRQGRLRFPSFLMGRYVDAKVLEALDIRLGMVSATKELDYFCAGAVRLEEVDSEGAGGGSDGVEGLRGLFDVEGECGWVEGDGAEGRDCYAHWDGFLGCGIDA